MLLDRDANENAVTNAELPRPCATNWADESQVLVLQHVVLSKPTGHESSSFWTLFHLVGVLCSFPACLLPLCATQRCVKFGNQPVLGCLRVGMGILAVRLRDAFGFRKTNFAMRVGPLRFRVAKTDWKSIRTKLSCEK